MPRTAPSFKRIDAHLDAERLEEQRLKREAQMKKAAEEKVKHDLWLASPAGIAAMKVKAAQEEKKRIDREKKFKEWRRKDDKEWNRRAANDRRGKFQYADRVVVANPLKEGCGKHDESMTGLRGRVRAKNCCKCIHVTSKHCYYVTITATREHRHFEECELELAPMEKK